MDRYKQQQKNQLISHLIVLMEGANKKTEEMLLHTPYKSMQTIRVIKRCV